MKFHMLAARLVWSAAFFGGCGALAQESPRTTPEPPTVQAADGTARAAHEGMQRVEELLLDAETARQIQMGSADELLGKLKRSQNGISAAELRKGAYQALLQSRSDAESFAQKARVLAALARLNKVPASEIAAAEQLDLQLNPNCADAWMRRAVYYAKEKNEKWSHDYFLDGLRRLDLKNLPEAATSMSLYEWCQGLIQAGRTDELTDALCQSLASTKSHQAGMYASRLVASVLGAPDTPENLGRLTRLLECVRTHQPHLPRALDNFFPHRVKTLEEQGAGAAATETARTFLLSWWAEGAAAEATKVMRSETQEFKVQREYPQIWGYNLLSEKHGSSPQVFDAALREPRGSFLEDLEKLAREHPDDEETVSAALVTRAMVGRLPAAALAPLEECYPLARMRVAWKVCEHVPVENLPAAEVATLLLDGAKVLLQHNANVPGRMPYPLDCVKRVMQHLEALGAKEELALLARQFVERISGPPDGKNRVLLHGWTDFHQMIAKYAGEADRLYMVQSLKEGLRSSMHRNAGSGTWNEDLIHVVTDGYDKLPPNLAPTMATFVYDAWIDEAKVLLENHQLTFEAKKRTPFAALGLLKLLLMSGTLDEHKVSAMLGRLEAAAELPDMPGMKWLTEPLHYAKNLLDAKGEALPMALLRIELPAIPNGTAKVAWQMDARSPERIENERRLLERDFGDRMEGVLDVNLLPYLDGKYDLDIYAGAKEELMRPVALVKGVKAAGAAEVRDAPASGWMRAVLKEPGTGVVSFGPLVQYSTAAAVLDSRVKAGPEIVQWGKELQQSYGVPITGAVPVMPGAEYLVTMGDAVHPRKGGRTYERDVSLVALNSRKQPVGMSRASELEQQSGPFRGNRWILRTDGWMTGDGWLDQRRVGTRLVAEDVVYLALTVERTSSHLEMMPVVVQPFGALAKDPLDPAALPMLEPEFLAPLGFAVGSWHVAPAVSRAVFSGKGGLSVHDTSTVPWKTLVIESPRSFHGRELVYALSAQEVLCFELPAPSRTGSGFRRIRWDDNLDYEQRPRTDLAFPIESGELHPGGKGLLLLGDVNVSQADFHAAWVDPAGQVSTITVARSGPSGEERQVAWWSEDDLVVVHDNGTLHHLTWKEGTLKLEKSEPGNAAPDALPKGARLGRSLRATHWRMDASRLLVRQDPMTQEVLARYLLPKSCQGKPIWLGDKGGEVILQTMANEVIRVLPQKLDTKKATSAPAEPAR